MSLLPIFTKLKPDWASWFFDPDNKIFSVLDGLDKKSLEKDYQDFYTSCYLLSLKDVNVVFVNSGVDANSGGLMSDHLYKLYNCLKSCGYYPTLDGKVNRWIIQGIFLLNTEKIFSKVIEELLLKFIDKDKLIWVVNKDFNTGVVPETHKIIYWDDNMVFKKINRELKRMEKDEINW